MPRSESDSPQVVLLTGAGVSADSGVATFRDAQGLWDGRRPEDFATPEAWARDRAAVWRFYQVRRAQLATVQHNVAHTAIARFDERVASLGARCLLITQNVDDLHERAGSQRVLHMHGEISVLRCEPCGHRERNVTDVDADRFVRCARCGHEALRPDVVWFGEVPIGLEQIWAAVSGCEHFMAIGTSGAVYPAAGCLQLARDAGATTWVQALEPPDNLTAIDRFRRGRAAEVVPALLDEVVAELAATLDRRR